MVENSSPDLVKILLVGNSSVGKTCIFLRYSEDLFNENHLSTIGLDYFTKDFEMDDGQRMTFQIWDTAGQDRFKSIVKNYFKGAHGILLIYDVTSRKSFDALTHWLNQITDNSSQHIKILVIGNKCDCSNREVTKTEGKELANRMGYEYVETSAKNGENINEAFQNICNIAYVQYKNSREEEMQTIIKLKEQAELDKKQQKNCCDREKKQK